MSFTESAFDSLLIVSKNALHADNTRKLQSFALDTPDSTIVFVKNGGNIMRDLNLKIRVFLPVRGSRLANSAADLASHKFCFDGNLMLRPSFIVQLLIFNGISFELQPCKQTKDLNDDPIPPDTSSM